MKCPKCAHSEIKVTDSRDGKDGTSIRRRRECLKCKHRFTTHERIEKLNFVIVKKDGRREPFDRNKIIEGLQKACEKRPVSVESIENLVADMEREFQERGEKEIASKEVGETMIAKLYELDEVAYVRFASVYRSFKDVSQFMNELEDLLKDKKPRSSLL